MLRRFVSSLAATTVCVIALTSSAASAGSPEQAASDALIPFQAEIMLLVELGAFSGPLPVTVRQVHDDWKSYASGLSRAQLIDWLSDVDVQGSGLMINLATPIEPAIIDTLSMMSPQDMDALANNSIITVDQGVYGRAWTLLDDRSTGNTSAAPPSTIGASPSPAPTPTSPSSVTAMAPSTDEPIASAPTVAGATGETSNGTNAIPVGGQRVVTGLPPRTASGLPTGAVPTSVPAEATSAALATTATTPATNDAISADASKSAEGSDKAADAPAGASTSTDESNNSSPIIALAAALAIAIAATALLVRRRGRPASQPSAAAHHVDNARRFDDVLAAGRRLARQMEPATLDRAICDEARTILDGATAVLVKTASGLPVVAATSTAATTSDAMSIDISAVGQSAISRTIDTAQAIRTVGAEPLLAGRSTATLTVPIASGGMVIAALAVLREESRPFQSDDQDLLGRLASLAGVALEGASRHDQLTEMTFTDALTTLANRRRLDRDLQNLLSTPVAFVMVDIDHFKHFNDTNGHPAGDELLRQISKVLAENVRPNDVVYRYGGEEFSVLLPDSNADEARQVAERLCSAVAGTDFAGGDTQPGGRLTISVGVATTNLPDAMTLKQQADRALYDAKQTGRNRVVIAPTT